VLRLEAWLRPLLLEQFEAILRPERGTANCRWVIFHLHGDIEQYQDAVTDEFVDGPVFRLDDAGHLLKNSPR